MKHHPFVILAKASIPFPWEGRMGRYNPIRRILVRGASHDYTYWILAFASMTGVMKLLLTFCAVAACSYQRP